MGTKLLIVLGILAANCFSLHSPTSMDAEMISQTTMKSADAEMKEPIVLHDTSKNFDYVLSYLTMKRNIEEQSYMVKLCLIRRESELRNCSRDNIIAVELQNDTELIGILHQVHANFNKRILIVITNRDIDVKHSIKLPVVFLRLVGHDFRGQGVKRHSQRTL